MKFQAIQSDTSNVPLYQVVSRALLSAIQKGQLKAGDTLASETELSREFGVSVGTLRKAVDELVAQQILLRRQGRGTFVATHTRDRFLFQFFQVQRQDGLKEFPKVETIDFEKGKADALEASQLHLTEGDPIFRLQNLLSLQDQPVVFDRLCLPAALFKGLSASRVKQRPSTLYHLYQTEFGITVVKANERLRAVPCGKEAAKALGISVGTSVIELRRLAIGLNDKPVEYRVSTINTRHHDYVSQLAPS